MKAIALAILAGSFLFSACNMAMGNDLADSYNSRVDYAPAAEASRGLVGPSDRPAQTTNPEMMDDGSPAVATERKVIYSADYQLRTSNLDVALQRAKALCKTMGGWVQEEASVRFTFRVPSSKFWETAGKISEIGSVVNHSIKSQDVTEQYLDLGIRLSVRKKFLSELQELYSKGGSLQDLLAVKKEIDRVTEEIETLEGRIRFLREQIEWSTIRLTFQVQSEYVSRDFNLPFEWLKSLGIQTLLTAR